MGNRERVDVFSNRLRSAASKSLKTSRRWSTRGENPERRLYRMSSPITAAPKSPAQAEFVTLIASAAAIGGFLFGFDTAVINGAVLALQRTFAVGDWMIGLAVSLALLGSAAGAFAAGPIADHIGRTRTMLISSVMFFVSAIGSGVPFGIWDFIAWRVLGGVAVGAASVVAPAYIAEVAPAQLRGRLGSLQQLAIVVGIFIALLTNYAFVVAAGSAEAPFWFGIEAWRWMFWAEALPALVYGIGALLVPESPRYLVANMRNAEAEQVLSRIIGATAAQLKVKEIQATVHTEVKPRLRDIKGSSFGLLPIVWIGIALSVFQQFIGINVIFYYGSTLWRAVGFTESNALWVTVITSLTNIVTTIVAILFVDRIGRKPLLLIGSIGMTIALATMAFFFGTAPRDASGTPLLTGTPALLALIAANLYVFCFGFSWGPMVWVLLGEMFNNQIRGAALAIAASAQWISNFIVSTTFPPMASTLGLGISYGIYATFALLSFFFVSAFIRETKGKELEEM